MQSIKHNTPAITAPSMSAADAMRGVIVAGKQSVTAALALIGAQFVYIVNVNILRSEKDKDYLSRGGAIAAIKKALEDSTDVGFRQLHNYVSYAEDLLGRVAPAGKKQAFPALVQNIGKATSPDAALKVFLSWLEKDYAITTMNDLGKKLGYSTTSSNKGKKASPAKRVENLTASITNIAEAVKTSKNAPELQRTLVHDVAQAMPDPLLLAKEAVKRYGQSEKADPEALESLIKLCNSIIEQIEAMKEKQEKVSSGAVAAKKKQPKAPAHARK